MKAVGERLHAPFDSNQCKRAKSHSTCVTLKKAHSLGKHREILTIYL